MNESVYVHSLSDPLAAQSCFDVTLSQLSWVVSADIAVIPPVDLVKYALQTSMMQQGLLLNHIPWHFFFYEA